MWHQGHLLEVKYYRTLKTEEVLTQGKVQDNQEQGWSNSTPSLEDKNWERPTSRDRVRWEHKTIWSQQEHIKFGNCVLHRVLPREKPDLLPSLDFSEVLQPAPTDAKHSDNQGERRGTGRVSGSVTLRPSRIPTLRGRMPKSVVNSTIHRRREIQVDIAHLLQIQSCSNDIARNTLPGDRSRVFPQSWVCRRGFFTPENHSAVSFVQWFPWRSWCRGVSSISDQDPWACRPWAWGSCSSVPWDHRCRSCAPYCTPQGSPGGRTAAGETSCSWPGFLMASPLSPTTDTGARSERAASWGSGKDPFSRASLHWED